MTTFHSSLRALSLGSLLAMTTAAIPALAHSASNAPDITTAADQKIDYCPEGLESLLPGDYYACRAKYHLQRNHPGQAIDTLQEAAYWANKDAAYTLGLMYFNGDTPGIPTNHPLGLAWLALATERHNPVYVRSYLIARAHCTPAEIQQATALWMTLKAKYSDHVAGLRAMRRFDRGIRDFDEAARVGGTVYLNGYGTFPQSAFDIENQLRDRAAQVFNGLQGTVTVGELQPLFDGASKPARASSSATAH